MKKAINKVPRTPLGRLAAEVDLTTDVATLAKLGRKIPISQEVGKQLVLLCVGNGS